MGKLADDNLSEADVAILRGICQRLSGNEWAEVEVINAYVRLVNSWGGKTFAFSSFFFTKLEGMQERDDYSFGKLHKWVKKTKVNLRHQANILFPINIKKQHWLLVNVNVAKSTFEIIDSLESLTPADVREGFVALVAKFLQDYFRATQDLGQPEVDVKSWKVEVADCEQQTNGVDCGVFVCHNMRLLAQGKTKEELKCGSLPESATLRQEVMSELLKAAEDKTGKKEE